MQIDQEMVLNICALTTIGCTVYAFGIMCMTFADIVKGVMKQEPKK